MCDPSDQPPVLECLLCAHTASAPEARRVRCNVRRFRDRDFNVWRCAHCQSLHCEPVENLAEYYDAYPIRNQALDYFSRAWYGVVLKRLLDAGLKPDHRILDFGCNQGLLLAYLKENGFADCHGYDPYVERFSNSAVLEAKYDWVISLDVIEHDAAPREFLERLRNLLSPHGKLCIETPNAAGINLNDSEEFLHALHVPYHVHILSEKALKDTARQLGLHPTATFKRWYMDSWQPGTARRLFESLLKFGDNDIDSGYEPPRLGLFLRHPILFLYLVLGYHLPDKKTDHMMMIFSPKP